MLLVAMIQMIRGEWNVYLLLEPSNGCKRDH